MLADYIRNNHQAYFNFHALHIACFRLMNGEVIFGWAKALLLFLQVQISMNTNNALTC